MTNILLAGLLAIIDGAIAAVVFKNVARKKAPKPEAEPDYAFYHVQPRLEVLASRFDSQADALDTGIAPSLYNGEATWEHDLAERIRNAGGAQ